MKRFFCTVCKRIKRVRNYPSIIENETDTLPSYRHGVCNHHSNPSVYSTRTIKSTESRKVS